jgi:hypothetical protein
LPSNEVLGLRSKLNVLRKVKSLAPVDNLAICVMCFLGAERRPTNLTFEHDRAQTPPITVERITIAAEDLGSYVVRCANGRVRHDTTRLSPVIDRTTIADRQVDLVKVDRIAVTSFARGWCSLE